LEVKKFCEQRDWDQYHNAKDLAIGIITEASELLELFRFKNETEQSNILNDNILREKISEELSDILFFVFRFSQRFDIDLSDSFKTKMAKNGANYPIEKSKGLNKKYTEY
jgi:NTP pyrophosphatase (non-canonical NTP hydrolase)